MQEMFQNIVSPCPHTVQIFNVCILLIPGQKIISFTVRCPGRKKGNRHVIPVHVDVTLFFAVSTFVRNFMIFKMLARRTGWRVIF